MVNYPYISTTGKLQEFLDKISGMGVPSSATSAWLPTIGFGSTNHRPILKIMRFIGFLEGTRPTDRWIQFRDETKARRVMAEALTEGYSELYEIYPDADIRSDEELRNYFKGQMTAGEQVISKTVSTFKTLCKFAEFGEEASDSELPVADPGDADGSVSKPSVKSVLGGGHDGSVSILLNVQVDGGTSVEQIHAIFDGLRTLLGSGDIEDS